MVIQCPECQTRFKMADEKAKAGTKVRCSRCKHIFPVQAPDAAAPETIPPAPPPPPKADVSAADAAPLPRQSAAPPAAPSAPASAPPPAPSQGGDTDELDLGDFSLDAAPAAERSDPAAPAEAGGDFDFDDFSLDAPTAKDPGPATDDFGVDSDATADATSFAESPAAETDFSFEETSEAGIDFSFDETPADAFDFSDQPSPADEAAFPGEDSSSLDGFSFDTEESASSGQGIGDRFSFDEEEAEAPQAEGFSFAPEGEEFSFGDLSAEAFATEASSAAPTEGDSPLADGESTWSSGEGPNDDFDFMADSQEKAADQFDFSTMTFGEDTPAVAPPVMEAPAPQPVSVSGAPLPPEERAAAPAPDEPLLLPPAVKPRKGPISGILAFVLVLLVLLCAAAGYFYLQGGLPDLAPLIARITGETSPPAVAGQIRVADLNGYFVENVEAGQLFVIQGRAINDFPEARSAIAVKGVLYNKGGKPLLQQTVFSGNVLDEQALRALPFAKIEESMNNQFGDSLSNLNIAPGKSIPFTIVFKNLPGDLAEFTAEVTDSKPGAG